MQLSHTSVFKKKWVYDFDVVYTNEHISETSEATG